MSAEASRTLWPISWCSSSCSCGRMAYSGRKRSGGFDAMIERSALPTSAAGQVALPGIVLTWLPWVVLAFGLLVVPQWLGDYWMKAILIPTLIFGLAALGLNFVTGYAGLIS